MFDTGDWLLTAYVATLFVLTGCYLTMSRWWTNPLGKLFLAEHLIMLAIMTQVLVTTAFGTDYWGRDVLRNSLYGFATVAGLSLVVLVLIVQSHDRAVRRATDAERKLRRAEETRQRLLRRGRVDCERDDG